MNFAEMERHACGFLPCVINAIEHLWGQVVHQCDDVATSCAMVSS